MRSMFFLYAMIAIIVTGMVDVSIKIIDIHELKKTYRDMRTVLQHNQSTVSDRGKHKSILFYDRQKMIDLFVKISQSNHLSLQSFSVSDQQGDSDRNQMIIVNAAMTGDFQKMVDFFDAMESQGFLFRIQSVNLYDSNGLLKLKMSLVVSTYFLPIAKANQQTMNRKIMRDPFAPFYESDAQSALSLCSVKDLRFAGFLSYQKYFFALILFPDEQIRQVLVGDQLGVERARVVRMSESGVWLEINGHVFLISS